MSKYIHGIIRFFLMLSLTTASLSIAANTIPQIEIRKVTPPKLQVSNIKQQILCYRPVRKGGPKMTVENRNGKWVVHNYGHGGGGWSLGPGSADYVVSLLETSRGSDLSKKTPITIIGAGALGLFTAYTLVEKGYKHVTIVAEKYEDLTSHNAGANFSPAYGVKTDDQAFKDLLYKISYDSLKFYTTIAKKEHPIFKNGAMQMPAYFQTSKKPDLEPYVGELLSPAKNVILDFGNGTTQEMLVYEDALYIDTGKMMNLLKNYLKGKVKFIKRKVNHFSEIKDEIIINCAGLGAKGLILDEELISVQGHLVLLKDQNPQDMQQLILVETFPGKSRNQHEQDISRMLYIFPKKLPGSGADEIGVIGGTYIEGATSQTPNEEEFALIMQRAREFYGLPLP